MPEKPCTYCGKTKYDCFCEKIPYESAFAFFFFHTIYKDIIPMATAIDFVKDIEQQSKKQNHTIKTELFEIKPENCHWCGCHKDKCVCEELTKNQDSLFAMLYNYIIHNKIPEEATCKTISSKK